MFDRIESRSQSYQTYFLRKRRIFPFFATKLGHRRVHTFFYMLQTLKLNSKNRKTEKWKFGWIDSRTCFDSRIKIEMILLNRLNWQIGKGYCESFSFVQTFFCSLLFTLAVNFVIVLFSIKQLWSKWKLQTYWSNWL